MRPVDIHGVALRIGVCHARRHLRQPQALQGLCQVVHRGYASAHRRRHAARRLAPRDRVALVSVEIM